MPKGCCVHGCSNTTRNKPNLMEKEFNTSNSQTQNDDDSDWDTDLGSETDSVENLTFDVVSNNKENYKEACKSCGVIPASYFLRNMTNQRLNMAHRGLGEMGTKAMAIALVTNTHLTALDLTDNALGAEGVRHICEMMTENCYITELDLSENDVGFDGVKHICEMLSQIDSLRRLTLRRNSLDTKCAVLLSVALKENTGLRYINLSDNCFGEEAGLHLAPAIASNEYLDEINLSWNHLRNKGAFAIAKALRENMMLKRLDLSWNGFGDDGLYVLSESLVINASLQQLNISSNRISHVGACHLQKGLKANEGLSVLKIGQNPLQHGVTFILQAIKSNPNSTINELDLTDVQVNNEFINLLTQMQNHNPDLKVYHGGMGGSPQKAAERPKPMKVLREYIKNNQMRVFDFFKSLDKDKSMSISIGEFVRGLKETGVPLRNDELLTLVRSLDLDGDGEIDYKELLVGHQEMQKAERDEKLKDKAYKERKKKLSKNLKPSTPSMAANIMVKSPSPIVRARSDSRMKELRPSSARGLRSRTGNFPAGQEQDISSGNRHGMRRRSKTFTDGFDIVIDTSAMFLLPPSAAPSKALAEEK